VKEIMVSLLCFCPQKIISWSCCIYFTWPLNGMNTLLQASVKSNFYFLSCVRMGVHIVGDLCLLYY
jgi:hypothetical protein